MGQKNSACGSFWSIVCNHSRFEPYHRPMHYCLLLYLFDYAMYMSVSLPTDAPAPAPADSDDIYAKFEEEMDNPIRVDPMEMV